MTLDLRALITKLSQPWWSPHAPHESVMQHMGKPAGAGLIVGTNYGAWNLALLAFGSFSIPATLEGHSSLVAAFVDAKRLATLDISGYPLGSYAMLMSLPEFRCWLGTHESKELGNLRNPLRSGADRLLKSPVT